MEEVELGGSDLNTSPSTSVSMSTDNNMEQCMDDALDNRDDMVTDEIMVESMSINKDAETEDVQIEKVGEKIPVVTPITEG